MKYSVIAAKKGKVAQTEIAMPELRPAALLSVNVSADEAKIADANIDPIKYHNTMFQSNFPSM